MKTYHYIVSGSVQGVFFRYYTKEKADKLRLKGTVQNLFNGDVEVYVRGDPKELEKFETYLHHGPASAEVKSVTKNEIESEEIYPDFKIIY